MDTAEILQAILRVDDKEKQGEAAKEYPVRPGPGPEVLEASKARVNKHLSNIIHQENRNLGGENILVLARACFIPWTTAYHNRDALNQLVRGIDQEYLKYAEDNEVFRSQWHGAGDMGEAISLLGKVSLKKYLDRPIEGTDIQRRSAWTEMLVGSRDWQVRHRRLYSNQAMTVDLGMYRCNRGIAVLEPKRAWPEKMAIKILHEASGILPYSGPHKEKAGRPSWPLGKRFKQTTEMGLSRELGYVGGYGELIVPIIRDMYGASKPRPGGEGDPKLKEQLLRVAKARAVFRYPTPDKEGFRAMRMETVIGWRDWHYPGRVTYDQMPCDDGCPGDTAGELMDPELIGYARQMIDDNQFFAAIDEQNNRRGVSVFKALMRAPGNYEKIKNYRGELGKLPMAKGSPDFVFADTGDGVVALKHGDDILFTSLYWRARFGINNLARVHFLTPLFQHDATVAIQTVFDGSGQKYEIRNRANMAFTNRYEEEYQQQGKFVTDFKPGKENLYAGKGDQYLLVFGDYCIAMNCSSKKFSFPVPKEFIGAKVLSGESTTEVKSKYRLQSKETLVLFKG